MPKVAIVECHGYPEASAAVGKAVELLGGAGKIIPRGGMVLIKPNLLVSQPPEKGLTTHPSLIEAVAKLCLEAGAGRVVVAENPIPIEKGRDVFPRTGAEKAAKRAGAEVCYLDESPYETVDIPGAKVLRRARIPKMLLEADAIIDMPKMKTHLHTTITVGIKNMMGILPPEQKLMYHREDIHQKLVDIIKIAKPRLTVVDAVQAIEGSAMMGKIVDMSLVIAGTDVVATDAVAAAVMGFDPSQIRHIQIADHEKVGVGDLSKIDVVGEPVKSVKRVFAPPDLRLIGAFEGVDVVVGGACIGCLAMTRNSLNALQASGDVGRRRIFLALGVDPALGEEPAENVFLIGDCAIFSCKNTRLRGAVAIPGCPPLGIRDIVPVVQRRVRSQRRAENA